jgi:hypothetical protein
MQDKELYQHLLGLSSPWTVGKVSLDIKAQEVVVIVEHPRDTEFCCPECQVRIAVLRPCRRAALAAPGFLSIQDDSLRLDSTRKVP